MVKLNSKSSKISKTKGSDILKIIACVDKAMGLGYKNQLLYHIKADMEHFRNITIGGTVVMGYNTYLSLPNGALPYRNNVVLSRNHDINDPNVTVIRNKKALMAYFIREYLDIDSVWIIGGASIYEQFIDDCDKIYLTVVDDFKKADVFFPPIDDWVTVHETKGRENGLRFSIKELMRRRTRSAFDFNSVKKLVPKFHIPFVHKEPCLTALR